MRQGFDAITIVAADVGDDATAPRLAGIAQQAGRLRVWVNCAAIVAKVPFAELDPAQWRETMRVDLDGVFRCCHAAFAPMAADGGGVIINLASLSGVAGVEKFPGLAAYNVAKAGVIALSEAIALEGKPLGVRCICLSPGAVETDMLRQAAPHLRAGVTPDDVAAIIAFLVTESAASLTGANIPIFSNE